MIQWEGSSCQRGSPDARAHIGETVHNRWFRCEVASGKGNAHDTRDGFVANGNAHQGLTIGQAAFDKLKTHTCQIVGGHMIYKRTMASGTCKPGSTAAVKPHISTDIPTHVPLVSHPMGRHKW
eukprot:scaffold16595_cov232-Amphora_coffeaeformis.AAC.8